MLDLETIDRTVEEHGSIRSAAPILGVDESTIRRWIKKQRPPVARERGLKLLAIDIETRPHLSYHFGMWDQNIGLNSVKEFGGMICFVAKWLDDPSRPEPIFASDFHQGHARMVELAWELLDEADVLVHFNGIKFDTPHIQREFAIAGLTPPRPFRQIDLLQVARRQFKFASNKLAHVAPQLGLESKVHNEGMPMWIKCMAGDPDAWANMEEYNLQDVALLEQLYDRLLPWIHNHPNLAILEDGCIRCGSTELQPSGLAYTNQSAFPLYTCSDCGTHQRGTKRVAGATLTKVV